MSVAHQTLCRRCSRLLQPASGGDWRNLARAQRRGGVHVILATVDVPRHLHVGIVDVAAGFGEPAQDVLHEVHRPGSVVVRCADAGALAWEVWMLARLLAKLGMEHIWELLLTFPDVQVDDQGAQLVADGCVGVDFCGEAGRVAVLGKVSVSRESFTENQSE